MRKSKKKIENQSLHIEALQPPSTQPWIFIRTACRGTESKELASQLWSDCVLQESSFCRNKICIEYNMSYKLLI
jgi:hypothetical protein